MRTASWPWPQTQENLITRQTLDSLRENIRRTDGRRGFPEIRRRHRLRPLDGGHPRDQEHGAGLCQDGPQEGHLRGTEKV